jgi:hypothetical protein
MRQEIVHGQDYEDPNAEPLLDSLRKVNENFKDVYETDVIQSNTIPFTKAGAGSQVGRAHQPRTGHLIFDDSNAIPGGCAFVYYQGTSISFSETPLFLFGTLDAEGLNIVFIIRDVDGNFIVNIQSNATGSPVDPTTPTATAPTITVTDPVGGTPTATAPTITVTDVAGSPSATAPTITVTDVEANRPPTPVLKSLLWNFRIEDSNPNRLYFDSLGDIDGMTTQGFTISGKTIAGVTINTGLWKNHYFTVTSDFNFWDNSYVRLGGGDGTVYDFYPAVITNNIPQPATTTERWVTTAGDNGNAGTSEGAAWASLNYAMNNSPAGTLIHLRVGDYGDDPVTIASSSDSGTASAPIVVQGYKTTEGDLNGVTFYSYGDGAFDTSAAPTLNGGDQTDSGIDANNVEYIILKNIQIENYLNGIDTGGTTGSNNWVIDNVAIKECGAYGMTLNNGLNSTNNVGGNVRVTNSVIYHGESGGLRIWGGNNLLDGVNVYADNDQVTGLYDYYISLYDCYESIVQNCHVERGIGVDHTGHGIGIKSEDTAWTGANEYNLIYNNTIKGIKGGVEFRHTEVKHNYSVGNVFTDQAGNESGGVHFRDNCSYNISINDKFLDLNEGVRFYDQDTEQGDQSCGNNNKVINGIFDGCSVGIASQASAGATGTLASTNNEFIHCTFKDVTTLVSQIAGRPFDNTNTFENCLFDTVTNRGGGSFTFTNNLFYNGFTAEGTGQLTTNPQLDLSYEPQATFADIDASKVSGADYDYNGGERGDPTTRGAVKSQNE